MDAQLALELSMNAKKGDTGLSGQDCWRSSIQQKALAKSQVQLMKQIAVMAAMKIQAIIRGFLGRCCATLLFERSRDEAKCAGIRRVQALCRGHAVRFRAFCLKVKQQRKAATQIQRIARGMLDRDYVTLLIALMREKMRENKAASKLQSIHRQMVARRYVEAKRQEQAARVLQVGLQGSAYRSSRTKKKRHRKY